MSFTPQRGTWVVFADDQEAHLVYECEPGDGGAWKPYAGFLCDYGAAGDFRLATDADERCQVCLAVSRKFAEAAGLVVTE